MRTFRTAILGLLSLLCASRSFGGTNSVTEVNLHLRDLVYDPVDQKLYATSFDDAEHLLQLDPAIGSITASYSVGSMPSRLVLDSHRGLLIGLNGEGEVRRFNLDSHTAEARYDLKVGTNSPILDIAPSSNDSDTFAATADRTYLVRDGSVQPHSVGSLGYIVMAGNYVFGTSRAYAGPTGLSIVGPGVNDPTVGIFELELADGRIYSLGSSVSPQNLQDVIRFNFPFSAVGPFMPRPANEAFAVNRDDNSYLLLTYFDYLGSGNYHLTRFDRSTGLLTGYMRFIANPGDWANQLTAAGMNRAAISFSAKLYLIDLAAPFAPGDLAVSAEASPSPASFGRFVTETVTVSNRGPGYVINAALTNTLSGSAYFADVSFGPPYSFLRGTAESHSSFQTLAPGESVSVRNLIVPVSPGAFTNSISAGALLETNFQNDQLTFVVPVANSLTNLFVPFAPSGTNITKLAYDAVTDEILLGTTEGEVFKVQLSFPKLETPPLYFNFISSIERLSVSASTRRAWIDGSNASFPGWDVYSIPLDGGDPVLEFYQQSPLRDLKASPNVTNSAAYCGNDSLVLHGPTYFYPSNTVTSSGLIQFSEDGTKIYLVSDLSCRLGVIKVTATNLTLVRRYPEVACCNFTPSENILYFDNGQVFDLASGTTITNLNLADPSWILLDPSCPVNVLTRTNNDSIIRRLDRDTFAELSSFHLGSPYSPTDAIQAGTNRIAFRDASGEAVLVQLSANANVPWLAALKTSDGLTLRFATSAAARYRIEKASSASNPVWTIVNGEIKGTGILTEFTVPVSSPQEFYRLVRLP